MLEEKDETPKEPVPVRIETNRVTTVDADGKIISEEISYESKQKQDKDKKKESFDNTVKIFGLIAILLPLWLFYLQQRSEFERQKAIMEYDAYSNLSTALHKYSDKMNFYNQENKYINRGNKYIIERLKDSILLELIPRSSLFKNDSLVNNLKLVKNQVGALFYYYKFLESKNQLDSILNELQNSLIPYNSLKDSINSLYFRFYFSTNFHKIKSSYLSYLEPKSKDYDSLTANSFLSERAYDKIYSRLFLPSINLKGISYNSHEQLAEELDKYSETIFGIGSWYITDNRVIMRIKDKFEKNINTFDSLITATNKLAQ
jgi:hypothetical protein